MMVDERLAPIVVFAFNRPGHLRKTLSALAACPESARSQLVVFCDGPRDEEDVPLVAASCEVVRERDWCGQTNLVVEPKNLGLADSIARGIGIGCDCWERVIALEDDVVVSSGFLAYMNRALDRFRHQECVMQISGHSFPAASYAESSGSSFLPFPTTWGWGTWRRAWKHYDPDMRGIEELDSDAELRARFDLERSYPYYRMLGRLRRTGRLGQSWGIRWYWSLFKRHGLVLYPHRTLVLHEGDDGSGTNYGPERRAASDFDSAHAVRVMPERAEIDEPYYREVRSHLADQNGLLRRGERFLRRAVRRYQVAP